MNELLFFFHICVVIGFTLLSLRLGQNGLTTWIVLQGILANLFVIKQISLGGFLVTCSDVFAVGAFLGLNLLQEYFGKEGAKKGALLSFVFLVFFMAVSQIHLAYQPAAQDTTQDAFVTILSPLPRIAFASIAVFFLVQQIDIRLFALLRGPLPLRLAISLFFSQFLDTVLFSFCGLYGLVASIFDVICLSFAMKCLTVIGSIPLVALSRRWIKHVSL